MYVLSTYLIHNVFLEVFLKVNERLQLLINKVVGSEKGLQKIFSQLVKIQANTLSHYVTDIRKLPLKAAQEISEHTNCNLHWLITGEGEMFINDAPKAVEQEEQILLPVLGEASCGLPISFIETNEEFFPIPKSFIKSKKENYGILTANGDSMSPEIEHNDFLLVENSCFNALDANNKIIAVLVDGELTIKKLKYDEAKKIASLRALNPKYEDLFYCGKEIERLQIKGIVRALFRKY